MIAKEESYENILGIKHDCVCIVGVKLPRVLSRRGRSLGLRPRLIPIITWCHIFFHSYQYSAHKETLKVWSESNRRLRCHVTTLSLWQVSQSPPPQWRKCACQFLRETERAKSNCPRPASSASRGDNEVDYAVCLKAEFQMPNVLSNENGKFYTTMIYPCYSRSVCFSMGSPAWWRFGLWSSGSSHVSRWRDAPLVCECQMWRRKCEQIDPHWLQGRQTSFWWMLSTISWKYFKM